MQAVVYRLHEILYLLPLKHINWEIRFSIPPLNTQECLSPGRRSNHEKQIGSIITGNAMSRTLIYRFSVSVWQKAFQEEINGKIFAPF
jgi:hypothetical protein